MELGTEPAPAWPEDEAQPRRRLWRAARYRMPFGNEINENNSSEWGWPPAVTYGKASQVSLGLPSPQPFGGSTTSTDRQGN